MADVIAAPEYGVVADLDERLDRVVLKDEEMFSEDGVAPDKGARTNVRGWRIAKRLHVSIEPTPQFVTLSVYERRIEAVPFRRKESRYFLQRNDRQSKQRGPF